MIATGGTGALGRAVVRAFLDGGDRVVVPWIVKAELDAISEGEAAARESGQLTLVEADVAEAAGADALVAAAGPGEIEVVVNGVGGFGGGTPVHETELELWDRMYRMNLRTAVATSRAALPGMITRGAGVILNVASQAALARPAGLAAYSASKDAVIVLTETLQKEVAEHGIRVNAVSPATIDTPANREAMPDADFAIWTPPARIAQVLTWLASDAAATVRGAVVPV
ncbi:MAG: SDR family NAD(P)-dependent oxidoreductase [Proteobacteria bacterium]|nr:SDR family NAD(P)-dependent oxidoreductase [Pseudomonadota bacterium]